MPKKTTQKTQKKVAARKPQPVKKPVKKKPYLHGILSDKRKLLVYIVVVLWCMFGVLAAMYETDFEEMGAYFLSMTAFVGAFIWAESIRKSKETSIFQKGRSSGREIMVYVILGLWVILGLFGVTNDSDMLSMAAYFASLSPFVSAYLLGQTYKPVDTATIRPELRDRYNDYGYGGGYDGYGGTNDYSDDDKYHVDNPDDGPDGGNAQNFGGDGENAEQELNRIDKIRR